MARPRMHPSRRPASRPSHPHRLPARPPHPREEYGPGYAEASRPQTFRPSSVDGAFEEARAFMGGRQQRKLAHNTYLVSHGNEIGVTYHGSEVVTYQPGAIVLNSHGYRTFTTKERFNWFLPPGYGVYQKAHEWYVHSPSGSTPFHDGIVIGAEGSAHPEAHERGRRRYAREPARLDDFTRQYMETALWSTNDESDERGGEPLDKNYSIDDIAPKTRDEMIADAADFQEKYASLLADSGIDDEQAGHWFWLSRNGHGAGFFDEDFDELQEAAESYGEFSLYVGDDGMIHSV